MATVNNHNHRNMLMNPAKLNLAAQTHLEYKFANIIRKELRANPNMSYMYSETEYEGTQYALLSSANITGCPCCDLAMSIILTQIHLPKPKTKKEIKNAYEIIDLVVACN